MAASRLFRVHVDGDDQAVQTQHLGENQDQDHADEQTGLLGGTAHTGVTNDANGEAGGEAGKADRQTGAQMEEATV